MQEGMNGMKENVSEESKIGIGLVTPSAPAPALFSNRFERGVKCLEHMGFNVKRGKYVSTKDGVTSASAIKRAEDINNMYADEEVSLVMATIGGDYSAEILPYLDWEIIRANRKGFIGYSDITVLLHAIGIMSQQVVFYGPTLMTEMSEYPVPPQLSKESFLQILDEKTSYEVSPCDSLLAKGNDCALPPRERNTFCPTFHKVIRQGQARGIVLGGCIEALERLRGTKFWPCFKNSIMVIETVDDEFDEKKWRSFVTDYTNMGVFKELSGIVIGQKMWNENSVNSLSTMLLEATSDTKIPILYGLPFGHISPIATIPLFTSAVLDADSMKLEYNKPFKYEYIKR